MNPAHLRLFLALIPSLSLALDWPQWRGPTRDGISQESGWKLSAEPKELWRAQVGLGFASFVTSGDRVLTSGHAEDHDSVWCLDATNGKVLWQHRYPADLGDKYYEGGTSNTPTIDGDKVYHLSRWGDLLCLELQTGKVLWSKNIQQETQAAIPDWGFAGAPVIQGNQLLLNVGKAGVALEKTNGKILWKSAPESAGYSSPYLMQIDGQNAAIFSSTTAYIAVNLRDGSELWSHRWNTRYGVNAADPILKGDLLFISSGYNKGCTALKLSNGAAPQKLWEHKLLKNQFNSSVLIGGHLYGIDGDSNSRCSLKCLELQSGKELWAEPSIGFGSLMAAEGKLIVLTEKGELAIVRATPEKYDELSRAQVLSGRCWSSPVLSHGRLLLRNAPGQVICLQAK